VDMFQYLTTYDHSLLWRTLRAIFAGGFFTTIHSITDVAAARAYLDKRIRIDLLHERVFRDWVCCLPRKDIL
jgi:hypothetical protein